MATATHRIAPAPIGLDPSRQPLSPNSIHPTPQSFVRTDIYSIRGFVRGLFYGVIPRILGRNLEFKKNIIYDNIHLNAHQMTEYILHISKLAFTEKGLLPKGIHTATLPELKGSFLVSGNGTSPTWDAAWRLQLANNLEVLFKQLNQIGISEVFIDGSFVEDIDHPNDIDGYFHCSLMSIINGENEKNLNHLDPKKSWGVER